MRHRWFGFRKINITRSDPVLLGRDDPHVNPHLPCGVRPPTARVPTSISKFVLIGEVESWASRKSRNV
jgi:hypothetical protein